MDYSNLQPGDKLDGHSIIKLGLYLAMYFPEHLDSDHNGMVYVHRYIAAKTIGRPLTKIEVVHHKDEIKSNNNPENLMVFRSNRDHTAYHNGSPIHKEGDVYVADFKAVSEKIINEHGLVTIRRYNYCPICGNKKEEYAKMCIICSKNGKKQKLENTVSREALKDLIRHIPFTRIGNMFSVTDNAIRKWCKKYNLPYRSCDIDAIDDEKWALI